MGRSWEGDAGEFNVDGSGSGDRYSSRKVVTSKCHTEEVEPGKFMRKCEKTEQIFKDCVGRPSEVVESIKEYSEEDVTDDMVNGSFTSESADQGFPFQLPGLRNDIEAIERDFFGGINRFFDAAEDMKNEFFSSVGIPRIYDDKSSSHKKHGTQTESRPPKKNTNDVEVDLSGLAKDV